MSEQVGTGVALTGGGALGGVTVARASGMYAVGVLGPGVGVGAALLPVAAVSGVGVAWAGYGIWRWLCGVAAGIEAHQAFQAAEAARAAKRTAEA